MCFNLIIINLLLKALPKSAQNAWVSVYISFVCVCVYMNAHLLIWINEILYNLNTVFRFRLHSIELWKSLTLSHSKPARQHTHTHSVLVILPINIGFEFSYSHIWTKHSIFSHAHSRNQRATFWQNFMDYYPNFNIYFGEYICV